MDGTRNGFAPRARTAGLIVRELAGELLVYDRDRNKAHCLNETAALIWKHCDGRTTVSRLRDLLQEDKVAPVDEQVIWYALDQFAKDHLLQERLERPAGIGRLSRRELIQRIGLAASIPLVASVVAPTVFAAASCTQACTVVAQCTIPGCQGTCTSLKCTP
jgi:Coenzyme PQQ synthesis protein D (PqqD)